MCLKRCRCRISKSLGCVESWNLSEEDVDRDTNHVKVRTRFLEARNKDRLTPQQRSSTMEPLENGFGHLKTDYLGEADGLGQDDDKVDELIEKASEAFVAAKQSSSPTKMEAAAILVPITLKGRADPTWSKNSRVADADEDPTFHQLPWWDAAIGFVIAVMPLGFAAGIFYNDLERLYLQIKHHKVTAMSLSRFANSVSEIACCALVTILWVTFCFFHHKTECNIDCAKETTNHEPSCCDKDLAHHMSEHLEKRDEKGNIDNFLHKFWKKTIVGQSLMPAGFAPRITALSMGFLLFVSQTIVKSATVTDLSKMNMNGTGYDGCRAISADSTVPYMGGWGARLWRKDTAAGCFGFNSELDSFLGLGKSGDTFLVMTKTNYTLTKATWKKEIGDIDIAVIIDGSKADILCINEDKCKRYWKDQNPNNSVVDVANLPIKTPCKWNKAIASCQINQTNTNYSCSYQCTKFQDFSLKNLITLSGSIFAGAAFLSKFCEWASTFVGYHLIDETTVCSRVTRILQIVRFYRTRKLWQGWLTSWLRRRFRRSACAIQLVSLLAIAYCLAPKIAKDGMFTPDYYTSLIFVYSALICFMQRYWNPYWCHPVIYTRKLWMNGKDDFYDPTEKDPESAKKTFDLFQWLHLTPDERALYIFYYARRVSGEDAELAKKKGMDARHVLVQCTKPITDLVIEYKGTCDKDAQQVTREIIIPQGTHGRLLGEEDGKYKVLWLACQTDKLKTAIAANASVDVDTTDCTMEPSADITHFGAVPFEVCLGNGGNRVILGQSPKNLPEAKDLAKKKEINSDPQLLSADHTPASPEDVPSEVKGPYKGWIARADKNFVFEAGYQWSLTRKLLELPSISHEVHVKRDSGSTKNGVVGGYYRLSSQYGAPIYRNDRLFEMKKKPRENTEKKEFEWVIVDKDGHEQYCASIKNEEDSKKKPDGVMSDEDNSSSVRVTF